MSLSLWNLLMSKSLLTIWQLFIAAISAWITQLTDKFKCAIWLSKGHLRLYWSTDQRGSLDKGQSSKQRLVNAWSPVQPVDTYLIRLTGTSSLRSLHLWLLSQQFPHRCFSSVKLECCLTATISPWKNNPFVCRHKSPQEYFGNTKLYQESSIDSCSLLMCF